MTDEYEWDAYEWDGNMGILKKIFTIPYRPQHVVQIDDDVLPVPFRPWTSDMPVFRFHVSPEALQALALKGADPTKGFSRLEVVWDANETGPVLLRATQVVATRTRDVMEERSVQ